MKQKHAKRMPSSVSAGAHAIESGLATLSDSYNQLLAHNSISQQHREQALRDNSFAVVGLTEETKFCSQNVFICFVLHSTYGTAQKSGS